MKPNQIICGDNLEVTSSWPPNSISAILTDPPYGLGFMGKGWDTFDKGYLQQHRKADRKRQPRTDGRKGAAWSNGADAGTYNYSRNSEFQQWFTIWAETMLRITKPGGFLLCFGGTRTYHRLACAIEDAGWEIRDCMMWLYGSGFPKSHNISKAIDKAKGVDPIDIGKSPNWRESKRDREKYGSMEVRGKNAGRITTPATLLAEVWNGYGTALKPAWEPIIVAMKPLDGTFAHNAEKHGVAGLNIDASRIKTDEVITNHSRSEEAAISKGKYGDSSAQETHQTDGQKLGRWPANIILDEEAGAMLDEQSGQLSQCGGEKKTTHKDGMFGIGTPGRIYREQNRGASRFFYCTKASKRERNAGCEGLEAVKVNDGRQVDADNAYQRGKTLRVNSHPTVKPLALMKYLCTLLKMPSARQIILDPFLGSGTTGMACKELGIDFIGIEKEQEYCDIAIKRIAAIPGKEVTLRTKAPPVKEIPIKENSNRQQIIDAAVAAIRERNQN